MAKIEKHSSGLHYGPGKLRAVFMLRRFQQISPDGYASFDFRGSPLAEITRIEWPAKVAGLDNLIALVPEAIANVLTSNHYARLPTDAEVAVWNGVIEAGESAQKSPAPAATDGEKPVDTSTSPPSTDAAPPSAPADAAPATPQATPQAPAPEISIEHPGNTASPPKASIPPAPNGDQRKGGKRK